MNTAFKRALAAGAIAGALPLASGAGPATAASPAEARAGCSGGGAVPANGQWHHYKANTGVAGYPGHRQGYKGYVKSDRKRASASPSRPSRSRARRWPRMCSPSSTSSSRLRQTPRPTTATTSRCRRMGPGPLSRRRSLGRRVGSGPAAAGGVRASGSGR